MTMFYQVLKKKVDQGVYNEAEFESLVHKCYCNDNKNPTILSYLGDIYRVSAVNIYLYKCIQLDLR